MEKSRTAHGEGFEEVELNADLFKAVREDSIDFAIFEKSSEIAVVPWLERYRLLGGDGRVNPRR